MSQLEQRLPILHKSFLQYAKKKSLTEREETSQMELLHNFAGQTGRLLCPFCQYSSSKNKTSAIIKENRFKCFSCGVSRRVE